MGGGTGNIRTYRISASNGNRTFGSILTSGASSAGGGSARRIYSWYAKQGITVGNGFYRDAFGVRFGEFASRAQWFLKNVV